MEEFIQVDRSILGYDLEKDSVLQLGQDALQESIRDQWSSFPSNFSTLPEADRVRFVEQFYKWIPMKLETLENCQKNAAASKRLRDLGNEDFRKTNYRTALCYYSMAVMFAKPGSEELGLAFANRSAALKTLGDWEGALEDIQSAFKNNYPESLKSKLETRRAECEEMMAKAKEADLNEDKAEMELRKEVLEEISSVKNPNPLMPSAADFVEVKWDQTYGRGLFVNRDVPAGTVILVEDPFVATTDAKWDVLHCHHCLKSIRRGVPCDSCVFAIYCTEDCLLKAKQGPHKFECMAMPYIHCHKIAMQTRMPFQIICKVGPKELYRIFSTKDPSYLGEQRKRFGIGPKSLYDPNSYLPIYHLDRYVTMHPMLSLMDVFHALFFTSVLEHETDFFHQVPEYDMKAFRSFVAASILRNLEGALLNTESLLEPVFGTDLVLRDSPSMVGGIDGYEVYQYGAGLYPTWCLANHSCDPNAHGWNTKDGKFIVVAMRYIRKGEQIFNAYCPNFAMLRKEQRGEMLFKHRDRFTCQCLACENNWPSFQDGDELNKTVFTCPVCSGLFFQHEKDRRSPRFKKCILKEPRLECGLCGKKYQLAELMRRLDVNQKLSQEAMTMLRSKQPGKAIRLIKKVVDYYQFHLSPPCGQQMKNQNTFMGALGMLTATDP